MRTARSCPRTHGEKLHVEAITTELWDTIFHRLDSEQDLTFTVCGEAAQAAVEILHAHFDKIYPQREGSSA